MATRVRIEDRGHQDWLILGPDVRIPFRGTEPEVVRAAKQVAAIMATAFFDVELDPMPRRMARPRNMAKGSRGGRVLTLGRADTKRWENSGPIGAEFRRKIRKLAKATANRLGKPVEIHAYALSASQGGWVADQVEPDAFEDR